MNKPFVNPETDFLTLLPAIDFVYSDDAKPERIVFAKRFLTHGIDNAYFEVFFGHPKAISFFRRNFVFLSNALGDLDSRFEAVMHPQLIDQCQKLIDRRVQLAAKLFCEARESCSAALLEQANLDVSTSEFRAKAFAKAPLFSAQQRRLAQLVMLLDSALMMLNACKTYGIVQNNQYQHQVDMLFMDLSRVTNLMFAARNRMNIHAKPIVGARQDRNRKYFLNTQAFLEALEMDFPEPGYRGSLKKFNRDPNGNGTFTDFGWLPRARKKQTSKKQSKANVKSVTTLGSAPRKLSEPTDN